MFFLGENLLHNGMIHIPLKSVERLIDFNGFGQTPGDLHYTLF